MDPRRKRGLAPLRSRREEAGRGKTSIGRVKPSDLIASHSHESAHRAHIALLNTRPRMEIVYYTDAHVELDIRELVALLNNRLTCTTHACHGHWSPKRRRQDPYIAFRVLPNRVREWRALEKRIYAGLRPLLTEEVTLDITEQYDLPDTTDAIAWRFKPAGYERARDVFRRQSDWRRTTYELINATCRLLRKELSAQARKESKRKVK